ncbi:MAG: phosphoglycerate mutase protein [Acidimicrobiaceae bacterium]|jgi:broad specificity phosphatase PhoE|nr:phosphoglycerate mutase protein [Acidimicrobiaceae bacterium]
MSTPSASSQPAGAPASIVLVRHGATQWSRNGRHTGRTDLPLDEGGRAQAAQLRQRLEGRSFERVLSSPLKRALETCRLAGFGDRCEVVDDLAEWHYGSFEGLTTAEVREQHPGWQVFLDGAPEGESPEKIGARADRVLAMICDGAEGGSVIIFSHGHFLRVLAARWLGLDPSEGRHFVLDAGGLSELGFEREVRALLTWNS